MSNDEVQIGIEIEDEDEDLALAKADTSRIIPYIPLVWWPIDFRRKVERRYSRE